MGRKRTRTGKQVYICLASLIFSTLAGCALVREFQEREEARQSLQRGQRLLVQGDYEGSLKENQKALSISSNRPPADEAIFNMGLIYAHARNPKKDYGGALALFRKLTKDYPQSPWVEQAKIWVGMLEDEERLSQAFKKLKEVNERLSQAFKKLKEVNERLNQMLDKSKQVDIEIEERKRGKER